MLFTNGLRRTCFKLKPRWAIYIKSCLNSSSTFGIQTITTTRTVTRRNIHNDLDSSMFDTKSISNFESNVIIEPFRIKMTEPIAILDLDTRISALKKAKYNLFQLKACDCTIDLLTDSGTGAMSQDQWAAMIQGDESYAHSKSWFKFENTIQNLTGHDKVIPTHQGRASERLFFQSVLKYFNNENGNMNIEDISDDSSTSDDNTSDSFTSTNGIRIKPFVIGNTHFDTTRANIEYNGGKAIDFLISEGKDTQSEHPFKGNIDINKLEHFLLKHENYKKTAMVIMTVTNNSGGGQPVSMKNMIELKELLNKIKETTGYRIYMFVDCARFAENSWFIQQREVEYSNYTCKEIAQKMFGLFDGAFMSMKKDGFGNIGGFLTLNTKSKNSDTNTADNNGNSDMLDVFFNDIQNLEILTEGFPTYGGLAGRDLEALAVGLNEVLDERYLKYRMASTRYLFNKLDKHNIPMLRPPGGHAIYLDGKKFCEGDGMENIINSEYLPAQALSIALYLVGGIRTVEIGTVMFGKTNEKTGLQIPSGNNLDLVRLAFPRRVYTQSHMDYIAEVIIFVYKNRHHMIKPLKIIQEPEWLRHFSCQFEIATDFMQKSK